VCNALRKDICCTKPLCSSALHKRPKIHVCARPKMDVTLKALANVSPSRGPRASSSRGLGAFALKPWVLKCQRRLFATLKGLRGFVVNKRRRNSFRVAPSRNEMRFPRVGKAQPWAGIGERFQRYSFSDKSSQKCLAFRLFVSRRDDAFLLLSTQYSLLITIALCAA
jgi:hypothetical protein